MKISIDEFSYHSIIKSLNLNLMMEHQFADAIEIHKLTRLFRGIVWWVDFSLFIYFKLVICAIFSLSTISQNSLLEIRSQCP